MLTKPVEEAVTEVELVIMDLASAETSSSVLKQRINCPFFFDLQKSIDVSRAPWC